MPEDGPAEPAPAGRSPIGRIRAAWANPAFRFVFLFLVYLAIASLAYPALREHSRELLDWLMAGTAKLEYLILLPFTDDVSARGTLVVLQGFSVKIIEECTGVYEVIIFSAAVLAFPTTWANRAIGFAFGIPTIYSFNLLRIAVLIVVGKYFPDSFEFMHLYFWQATLIVMITSVWALWIFKVVIREPRPDSAG